MTGQRNFIFNEHKCLSQKSYRTFQNASKNRFLLILPEPTEALFVRRDAVMHGEDDDGEEEEEEEEEEDEDEEEEEDDDEDDGKLVLSFRFCLSRAVRSRHWAALKLPASTATCRGVIPSAFTANKSHRGSDAV